MSSTSGARKENLKRADLSWEVYGDWEDDESKLVTDVYVALE